MSIEQLYELYLSHPFVKTDTRTLKESDLFFALRGPHFNGNEFAATAIRAGAAYAVIDQADHAIEGRTILVNDVLSTLQSLAGHHRQTLNIPFLAITGTNGKTTTKELIHQVLSTQYRTYTTKGNLNNQIGIPLTLLSIKKDAELAVIEMGANHVGEIGSYCQYTRPSHGMITNVGKAHLEGFGSLEGVRKGKGELFDFIRKHNGTAFIMWDYDYLREMSDGIQNRITFGAGEADLTGTVVQSDPYLEVAITSHADIGNIHTQMVGDYNLPNVLAAVSVGLYFGVPAQAIRSATEAYSPSNSRSQMIVRDSNRIILDAYNANPSSMKLAVSNFAKLQSENKVLILGGMAELGQDSLNEHRSIVELINQHQWKQVLLVGGDFLQIPHPYLSFRDWREAKAWYQRQQPENSTILIKGSRSMQMEKILE